MEFPKLVQCLFLKNANMNWKEELISLEQNKNWKPAIELLEKTINDYANNLDVYLSINYLLMNILVEEDYSQSEHDYYSLLLKKYFDESYIKFYNNPEFLFFIGKIGCMSEWYFEIEIDEAQNMIKRSLELEPENILYKWANYGNLNMSDLCNREKMIRYAKQALSEPKVEEVLKGKGSLGQYLMEGLYYWYKPDGSDM